MAKRYDWQETINKNLESDKDFEFDPTFTVGSQIRGTTARNTLVEKERANVSETHLTIAEEGNKPTSKEISQRTNLPLKTVNSHLRDIRNEYKQSSLFDHHRAITMRLAVLDAIAQQAWDEWFASKEDEVTIMEQDGDAGFITARKSKTRSGDAKYLRIILDAERQKDKLLGLDKVTTTINQDIPTWQRKLIEALVEGRITPQLIRAEISDSTVAEKIITRAELMKQ